MGAARFRTIALDVLHADRFMSPGMVDEKFGLNAEEPVEQVFVKRFPRIAERTACDVAHGIETVSFKLLGRSSADAPKISERRMCPKAAAVLQCVEFCDAYAVRIGRNMLRYNIHGNFGKIEICADARRCGNTGLTEYVSDEAHGERMCRDALCVQITRYVDEYFVDGVDMDIGRGDAPEINLIDAHTVIHIECHARRRNMVGHREGRMICELICVCAFTCEFPVGSADTPSPVDLFDLADDLKEPRTSSDAVCLECGGDGETDGLARTAFIRDNEIGR